MRLIKLMNTENDQGSGGGANNETPATPPPAPAVDMKALLQQIGGMIDEKLNAMRQELTPQQTNQQTTADDPADTVDASVRQLVDQRTGQVAGGIAALADSIDAMQFNQNFGALLTPEEMQQVNAVHADWRQKGIGFIGPGGKTTAFSRTDVANQMFGAVTLKGRAEQRKTQGNADAFSESQGRGGNMMPPRGAAPVDTTPKNYKEMSYAQRAAYHKAELDKHQGGI